MKINQKLWTIICLKNILNLNQLLIWKKQLFKTKNENKNNDLVNVIKSELIDLKKEIEKASEEEIKIEKPNEIVKIIEEILEFNRKAIRRWIKNFNTKPNA